MDGLFAFVNQSKLMWGMSMLMLQFGARYVLGDLGKAHEVLLAHEITKKFVVVAMFFVATRDIVVSFVLTIAYIIIVDGILHEDSKFCLIPKGMQENIKQSSNKGMMIPLEDYKKAQQIIKAYETQKHNSDIKIRESDVSYVKYVANISLAQK